MSKQQQSKRKRNNPKRSSRRVELLVSQHPLQQIYLDKNGAKRFRENKIVDHLLKICTENQTCSLNTLAAMAFSQNDREQFAQLIGYSLAGFAELSYVSNKTYYRAARKRVSG
jgi:hypothetical protein